MVAKNNQSSLSQSGVSSGVSTSFLRVMLYTVFGLHECYVWAFVQNSIIEIMLYMCLTNSIRLREFLLYVECIFCLDKHHVVVNHDTIEASELPEGPDSSFTQQQTTVNYHIENHSSTYNLSWLRSLVGSRMAMQSSGVDINDDRLCYKILSCFLCCCSDDLTFGQCTPSYKKKRLL